MYDLVPSHSELWFMIHLPRIVQVAFFKKTKVPNFPAELNEIEHRTWGLTLFQYILATKTAELA